jgi:hypothetical protein
LLVPVLPGYTVRMNSLPDIVQLVIGLLFIAGVAMVASAPEMLGALVEARRDALKRSAIVQAELDRKIAIAEASQAARQRGEAFTPPVDYDR